MKRRKSTGDETRDYDPVPKNAALIRTHCERFGAKGARKGAQLYAIAETEKKGRTAIDKMLDFQISELGAFIDYCGNAILEWVAENKLQSETYH